MPELSNSRRGEAGRGDPGRTPRRRVLNVRLLIGTIVVLILVVPSASLWHRRQMKRLAEAYRQEAEKLDAAGKPWEAATQWGRFLGVHPDDVGAKVRRARSFGKAALESPASGRLENAIQLLYEAAGVAPEQEQAAVRRPLAEILLAAGRFTETQQQADLILKADPRDSDARRLRAFSLFAQVQAGTLTSEGAKGAEAVTALEEAIELQPGNVPLARLVADIYRTRPELLATTGEALEESKRFEKADAIVDRMVRADAKNPEVLLARYEYRRRYGLPRAEEDLRSALQCDPNHAGVRFRAAELAQSEGARLARGAAGTPDPAAAKKKFLEAEAHYQHILEHADTPDPRAYLGLGRVLLAEKKPDEAVKTWQQGLASLPASPQNANQARVQFDFNASLAQSLLDLRRLAEAEKAIAAMDELIPHLMRGISTDHQPAARRALVQSSRLLRARHLMETGQMAQAASLLEDLTTAPGQPPAQEVVVWQWLGACHAVMQHFREAADAYEKALALAPATPELLLAAAHTQRKAGREKIALAHYQQLLDGTAEDTVFHGPDVWFWVATLRLREETAKPSAQRDWRPFAAALEKAREPSAAWPLREPWQMPLLEASYVYQRALDEGRREQGAQAAMVILRKAREQFGGEPRLLAGLISAYEQLGRRAEVDRLLDDYAKLLRDPVQACMARVAIYRGRGEPEKARKILEDAMVAVPAKSRAPIEYTLIEFDLEQGKVSQKDAFAKLDALASRMGNSLQLWARMTHLAVQLDDAEAMQRCERELERLEGAGGALWRYCRGRRLLVEFFHGKTGVLTEVERLVADLQRRHGDWAQTHVLAGVLHEAQNRPREAIAQYEEGIQKGARTAAVYERLVRLLYATDQYDRAQSRLAELGTSVQESRELSGAAIEAAWRQGELTTALATAKRGAASRPDDPLARIWLAQMLVANDRLDEAETEFKKAVELKPKEAVTREILWRFYVSWRKVDQARQALADLADNLVLTDAKRTLILAAGHEALSTLYGNEQAEADRKKAVELFAEAARLAPDEPEATLGLARLRIGEDPAAAEKLLQDFLRRHPENTRVQRVLAVTLARRGGAENWKQADALLEKVTRDEESTAADRRLQVEMLLSRGGKDNLARAQKVVQTLLNEARTPSDADRLMLARIYDRQGQAQRAAQQLAMVVDREKPSPANLATYVDLLLRQRNLTEAARQMDQLDRLAPGELGAVVLRARLLDLQGRAEEIDPLVEEAAKNLLSQASGQEKTDGAKKQQEIALVTRIGDLCASVKRLAAAERWYRRLLELEPAGYARLAVNLGSQGRMAEAIQLCADAAKSDKSPRPVGVLASALSAGKPTAEDFQAAEPLLVQTQAAHPDDAILLFSVATVRILQGRNKEAAELYERVLAKESRNVMALNNLATILAELPDRRKEAAESIERAIALAGPQPWLLDTKAWVALLEGNAAAAVTLLEEATASAGADARFAAHLALAYDRVGKVQESQKAWKRALASGVQQQVLTETEQKLLDEFQRKQGS